MLVALDVEKQFQMIAHKMKTRCKCLMQRMADKINRGMSEWGKVEIRKDDERSKL